MKHIYLFTSIAIFCFFLFSANYIQAQNAADPDTTLGLGTFNSEINATQVQADGKILVAGDFTYYKTTTINRLARLNTDGTLDNSFNIGSGANGHIYSIAIQADGKIIIGGAFTSFNGVTKNHLARLNTDGTLDNSFNIGSGADNYVYSIAIQSDGKIIIGGGFAFFNGVSSNYKLTRLNIDGTPDNSFNIGMGTNGWVTSITIQADGKIIIGGSFTSFSGVSINRLVRLNVDGTLDNSFNIGTGANDWVRSIAIQSDGKIIIGGNFISFNGVSINRLVRLNIDGTLDNSFNIGTGVSYSQINCITIQAEGKIIIGGNFSSFNGVTKNYLARLNTDGTLDNSFNIGVNNYVCSIAIQADGKIIIGGDFTSLNGVSTNRLARLNVDGTVENTFNIGAGGGRVYSVVVQPDGKIIVGGGFLSFNGVFTNCLVRLNANGTLDNSFNIGTGTNAQINSIAIQTDGKIIIGGSFTSFNGVFKAGLARLNVDGTLDSTFNIGSGTDYSVYSIAIQSDGKIIIGGFFSSFNGVSKNNLARLNADGTLDNTFNIGTGLNNSVYSIAIQADGKIIIGGFFTSFNGVTKNYLARINTDGTLDNTFNIGSGANNFVYSIAIQPFGKIIIGGSFTSFNGVTKNYLARLNADGILDNTFNIGSGVNGNVYSIAFQADGKIIIGGDFFVFNGVWKNGLARLNANGTLDNTFNIGLGGASGYSIAIQSDGKIIIGGKFSLYNGISYNSIVRLRGDPYYNNYNTIRGNIYTESNNDCMFQLTEKPVPYVVVKALPGPFYGGSDNYGEYQVKVDSGTINYTLTQEYNSIQAKLLVNQCATSKSVSLNGVGKDTSSFDFADSIRSCALLTINVSKSRMRRCFRSNTYVSYWNYGSSASSGAQIRVVYPSYIKPISSVPMWSSRQDSVLIYDIAALKSNTSGSIIITDSVSCVAGITGLTECIKASISPASNCVVENPAWDRSSMMVTGSCVNDNAVFVIKNDGSGDMTGSNEYRVYLNDTLVFTGTFQLNSGQSFTVTYPAEGQTIRLEADQHPLHPGRSRPRATVEGCGISNPGPQRTGLVTTAPQDDLDEEVAVTCEVIRDSYDPNDKQAMPTGIGATNMVAPGTKLEYTIRFQNTGTAAAYTVIVIDTLDVNLDVTSFTQGASSHPYTLSISGKGQAVLAFNFYNINLPDSTTDKLGSNGLVSFRVTVPSDAVLGTQIKNKAHIFFDYNSAIITNETMHTVDNTVYSNLSRGSMVQIGEVISGVNKGYNKSSVKIYPNPSAGIVTVEIPESKNHSEMRIISITGVLQRSVKLNNTSSVQQVNLEGISQGMYLYEIWEEGERKVGGMLQMK